MSDNLVSLSAEDLISQAYSLREEFFTLHDSDDLSDETLDKLAELVDQIESLQAEADRRVSLAVKREELSSKVTTLTDPKG